MFKNIKKIIKVSLIILLVIFSLPTTAILLVRYNTSVQTYLTHIITKKLSESLNAKIYIERVDIAFFTRMKLQHVFIEDQQKDTLLFANEIVATIRKLNARKRAVDINKIALNEANIHFRTDSAKVINFQFIIDAVSKKDTVKKRGWDLKFRNIEINHSSFAFSDAEKKETQMAIDFSNIYLRDFNLKLTDLKFQGDTTLFNLKSLQFVDKSSFKVNLLQARTSICKSHILLDQLTLITDSSTLLAPHLNFRFQSFQDFKNFIDNVKIESEFINSELNFRDVAFFASSLNTFHNTIQFNGIFEGKINNLKAKDFSFSYGNQTIFNGDITLSGLPEIKETFIYIDVNNFKTSLKDIEKLSLNNKTLRLPEILDKFGIIRYSGNFTGFINDFVAYGELKTDLGQFYSDLAILPDTADYIQFKGNFRTKDFDLGQLVNDTVNLGKLTLNSNINGSSLKGKNISAVIEGKISAVEVKKYTYKNIDLRGYVSNKTYDGFISVEDANIRFNFEGKLDFSKETPEFDFLADISKARLYKLNIDPADSVSNITAKINANFKGKNIDELNGEINLINARYERKDDTLAIEKFQILANHTLDTNYLQLLSDFIDARVNGKYSFRDIAKVSKLFIAHYIPSINIEDTLKPGSTNKFQFDIHFKKTKELTKFFFPSMAVAMNSTIEGYFDPANHQLVMHGSSPRVRYKNQIFNNVIINGEAGSHTYELMIGAQQLLFNQNLSLKNFTTDTKIYNDSLQLNIRWNNWDTLIYKGNIQTLTTLSRNNITGNPLVNIHISPSDIFVRDTVWHIRQANINIDSSTIKMNGVEIKSHDQFFSVHGAISRDPKDSLVINFQNLNIHHLNMAAKNNNTQMGGKMSGSANISNVYNSPVFYSNIFIKNFSLNQIELGDSRIKSQWVNEKKTIALSSDIEKRNIKILSLEGEYTPKSNHIDFNISIEKLRLDVFQPFTEGIISDLKGLVSGEVKVTGSTQNPKTNGTFKFQKTNFIVDYLQTRYNFSNDVDIKDNKIFLSDFLVNDMNGEQANVNGNISNKNFKDFLFDLTINATRFNMLNTREYHNNQYYGQAFATGSVKIYGRPKNLSMSIQAKTERNTKIFIPLSTTEEVEDYQFVRFIDKTPKEDVAQDIEPEDEELNLSGMMLDFNLDVTPDAEIQLIFDDKIGDIIRGKGYGDIKMEINTQGDFNMYGEYTIEEGNYLFTLQNIINKRFEVERGGTIRWTGNPMNAIINMKAVYTVKTSLYELLMDENYRKRIPVDCQINLTNSLLNPDLAFNITLPTADENTKRYLQNAINTEEKQSKQFIALLVINSFLPEEQTGATQSFGATSVGVTTAEMLSNQLSRWLSQISQDFDIGINYRPGDEISNQELELALSTQVFNDRISINGNVDVGGQFANEQNKNNANNIVGDVSVDVKLNQSGKLRFKAFTRSNDEFIYENSPTTQGVGLFYREEFNTFHELLANYLNKLKKEEKED